MEERAREMMVDTGRGTTSLGAASTLTDRGRNSAVGINQADAVLVP